MYNYTYINLLKMDNISKKKLINSFTPEKDPEMTPAKRFTKLDVKAAIYDYLSRSCGYETYSSATDSVCRDRIWGKIESLVDRSKKYINEEYYISVYEQIANELNDNGIEYDEKWADQLEQDIKKVLPCIVLEYLENNSDATYTNIFSNDHSDKLINLVKINFKNIEI